MDRKIYLGLLLKHYNRARKAVEQKRLNRALSLVMQKDELSRKRSLYHTTTTYCGCPDHQGRGVLCKHMIAVMLSTRVYEDAQKQWLGDDNGQNDQ